MPRQPKAESACNNSPAIPEASKESVEDSVSSMSTRLYSLSLANISFKRLHSSPRRPLPTVESEKVAKWV